MSSVDLLTLPGLIDCHVHCREPGLTRKGDMATESRAAVAGGVLTMCDMPNTVPPTVTVEAFVDKVKRAERITDCDIRFFFGITKSEHVEELRRLWAMLVHNRCCGVKLYFDHSTGNQKVNAKVINDAFRVCAELDLPLVAHCEDAKINEETRNQKPETRNVSTHSLMRPPESEAASIAFAIEKAKKFGTRFHVAHLSTKQGVELVRKAKREGLPVTCEVAPHHLFLTVEDYGTLGTLGKMNPPLRTIEHQEALWQGIADGTIDCIATDHAPHTLEEKNIDDPLKAPSGVPGIETMLPLLLTVASGHWPHPSNQKPETRNQKPGIWNLFSINDIVRLCFTNPNTIFRLGKHLDDVQVIIDPNVEWTIRGQNLHSKCGWTPYEGWIVKGKIVEIIRCS